MQWPELKSSHTSHPFDIPLAPMLAPIAVLETATTVVPPTPVKKLVAPVIPIVDKPAAIPRQ